MRCCDNCGFRDGGWSGYGDGHRGRFSLSTVKLPINGHKYLKLELCDECSGKLLAKINPLYSTIEDLVNTFAPKPTGHTDEEKKYEAPLHSHELKME